MPGVASPEADRDWQPRSATIARRTADRAFMSMTSDPLGLARREQGGGSCRFTKPKRTTMVERKNAHENINAQVVTIRGNPSDSLLNDVIHRRACRQRLLDGDEGC
jgi:hypothetical protein